jgi:hypothetical protein
MYYDGDLSAPQFSVTVQSLGLGECWEGVAAGVCGDQFGEVFEWGSGLLSAGRGGCEGAFGEAFTVVGAGAV